MIFAAPRPNDRSRKAAGQVQPCRPKKQSRQGPPEKIGGPCEAAFDRLFLADCKPTHDCIISKIAYNGEAVIELSERLGLFLD